MKKEIRVLSVKNSPCFIDWLLKFRYDDLIICPKSKYWDYRAKKIYTVQEQKILKALYNVNHAVDMFCPCICSGNRGDGSSYRNKCKFFKGYGINKDNIWNFKNPQKYILCSKAKNGKVRTQKMTSNCERRRLATAVARFSNLIHHFGSVCLELTSIEECLKCKYKTKEGCSYKIGCKKGEGYIIFTDCKRGICERCPERIKKC